MNHRVAAVFRQTVPSRHRGSDAGDRSQPPHEAQQQLFKGFSRHLRPESTSIVSACEPLVGVDKARTPPQHASVRVGDEECHRPDGPLLRIVVVDLDVLGLHPYHFAVLPRGHGVTERFVKATGIPHSFLQRCAKHCNREPLLETVIGGGGGKHRN